LKTIILFRAGEPRPSRKLVVLVQNHSVRILVFLLKRNIAQTG
jgi:hypothetical protein